VSIGQTLAEAKELAYGEMKKIHFEGIYYRGDIGVH
jgi:phosphoribosylamine--glycine ligase